MPYPTYHSGNPDLVQAIEAARVEYDAARIANRQAYENRNKARQEYYRADTLFTKEIEGRENAYDLDADISVNRVEALIALTRVEAAVVRSGNRLTTACERLREAIKALG